MTAPKIHLHKNDLPANIDFGNEIAVDCEMMGLSLVRDRLCLVQLRGRDRDIHLIQIARGQKTAPNLQKIMQDETILKIFHYARIDMSMIKRWLDIDCNNVFCTKIASKLARTYTEGHRLRDVIRDLLGIDVNKQQTHTNWGRNDLTQEQLEYAASDVIYIHQLKDELAERLALEDRTWIAQDCFNFLHARVAMDILGWEEMDVFYYR